jgi:ATP phosphoribosyltransferase regulatory subunit
MSLEPPVAPEALAAIRAPFLEYGATPIDPPVLQPLGLILDLAGEAMRERLILAQAEGGRESALRPDFTIAAARSHIESGRDAGRYVYEGKAFRAARNGSADPEEFLQVGLEVFESGGAANADADIVGLAWRAASAGGRSDLKLELGDAALFAAFIDTLALEPALARRIRRSFSSPKRLRDELERATDDGGAAPSAEADRLSALLSALPEAEAAQVLEELWALAGVEPVGGRSAAEIAHRLASRGATFEAAALTPGEAAHIRDFLAISDAPEAALESVARLARGGGDRIEAALAGWRTRLSALDQAGASKTAVRFSTAFGRDFGYYDGMLFEVRSAALGDERPVAAGGRYDSLFARLGSNLSCGAVGCMVRPARAWRGAA